MRSSAGKYFPGLDHLRALAAFLVFGWHFSHGFAGTPSPFGPSATVFLAPFNEGHCGVALFMCLSGYLFAKILDGMEVDWSRFYWNRFIRLAPLLIAVATIKGGLVVADNPLALRDYLATLLAGIIRPTWPNGAWSITVEMHFYCLLRIILPLKRRWFPSLFGFMALGLIARGLIYAAGGDVQFFAYWTIIGRIDQFILGIVAWEMRSRVTGRTAWMAIGAVAFFAAYQWFVELGGFYGTLGNRAIWIVLPTMEGAFFALLVAWYDTSFSFPRRLYWRMIEAIGAASYSIYLLHNFVVFWLAARTSAILPGMATWELSELVALLVFAVLCPLGWLSYRYVEMPFLVFRTPYARGQVGKQLLSAPAAQRE